MSPEAPRVALGAVRHMIDAVDDALLALLAARRGLVGLAAEVKSVAGQSGRDSLREQQVFRRARRLARRLGLPPSSSDRLMRVLIEEACAQQRLAQPGGTPGAAVPDPGQGGPPREAVMLPLEMTASDHVPSRASWLRLLPPPRRWAPLLRAVPPGLQARLLELAMGRVLAAPVASGALELLQARRLGIEVSDLGLRWVVELRDGRMCVCPRDCSAEATVRGSATDLLLLASRREDADTLFFQRRLILTGDTELGLTARNLLDQLPWQDVPLGLRIALHRFAGLAQAARAAHQGQARPA
jgi:O2-independent ubiquinone biosynthesis accessory factor UbiT